MRKGENIMRFIRYWLDNGYAGCLEEEVEAFPDDTTDHEIREMIEEMVGPYGDDHINGVEGWDWEEGWESEEDEETYYENIDYGWEDISEAEYKEFLGLDDEEDE